MASSNPLGGIVKLLVVAVLLWFAVTEGWPWLKRELDRMGHRSPAAEVEEGAGEGTECVIAAGRASEALGETLRRFRTPPYDLGAWENATTALEDRIWTAESACGCALDSCGRASEALAELRDLVHSVDGVVRGDATAFRNPARQQERIDELLDQARDLARQGR